MNKYINLLWLFLFPFGITILERLANLVFNDGFSIFVYSLTSIGLIAFSLLSKTDYGFDFSVKNKKILAGLMVLLTTTSLFLFFVLKSRGLLDRNWGYGWVVWMVLVFREELILRGIIQTKAVKIVGGKLLGFSSSIWFTSLIFSLWHLVNLGRFTVFVVIIQIVTVFLIAGPLYGWIREKTNNVVISYLCHISGDFFFYAMYTLFFSKLLFPIWK